MSQVDLKTKLNALRDAERINLDNEYIGDQGAKVLADFLKNNSCIRVLELRGNDITPKGIFDIFHALQPLKTIQSVSCEWNKIGIDSEGVNYVANLLMANKNIQHMGLANNSITGQDMDQLCTAIKASGLLSLDMKWNNLGSEGGQKMLKMLENSDKLIYLDLNGNTISEDIFDRIENLVKANRKKNNIPRERIIGVDDSFQGESTLQQPERDQQRFAQTGGQFKDSDGLAMIHHLENVLQQEKLHTGQIKSKLETELEDLERKERNDLRTIQDLEQKNGDIANQNKMIKFDIERLRDEFNILEKSNIEQVKTYEDRIRQNTYLMDEMEKKHRLNCEKMLQENNYRVKELARDWEGRCRALEERIKAIDIEKDQQDDELRRVQEKSIDLKIRQEQELEELTKRVQEEEFQKYQANLVNIESRISAVEEGHDLLLKKNGELVHEYGSRDKQQDVELSQYKDELSRLEADHEKFVKKNMNFKTLSEKLQNELNIKENAVAKLESEINSVNSQIESKKNYGTQLLETTKTDHQKERQLWNDEREEQLSQITELENRLRGSHMDNSRLRQEYLKLSEILQTNVSKEIFSTFTKHNYY